VEPVGQQLVLAVASAALRAPVAIGDLTVTRRWRVPGAGGGRPAAGACLGVVLASADVARARGSCTAAAVDLVLQLKKAPASGQGSRSTSQAMEKKKPVDRII
jgi:hypothetical protein